MHVISTLMLAVALELWGHEPKNRLGIREDALANPSLIKAGKVLLAVSVGIVSLIVARDYLATVVSVALIGLVAWRTVTRFLRKKKDDQRTRTIAQFLGLVTSELRSGAEVGAAITQAAGEVADQEVASALTAAGRTTRSGRSGAHALNRYTDAIPQLRPLASVWAVSETYGISLTELLSNAQQRIDAATKHNSATAASLQGANATAGILALLPLLGIAMGYAMGVDTLAFLLGGGIGGIFLVTGVALLCAGVALSQKIITSAQQ